MRLTKILISISLICLGCIAEKQINNTQASENTENTPNTSIPTNQPTVTKNENDPVIAAAGDIACDPENGHYNNGNGNNNNCHQKATSDLLINENLTAVLPLGDTQYEKGTLSTFKESYEPSWGRVKHLSYPVVGNHEYYTENAQGYFDYFGEKAGDPQKGYYSYDLGEWHLIALNSNCSKIGGCGEGSPQLQWLKEDLEAHPNVCTLAYFHHPRFSSGQHGNNEGLKALWQDLDQAGVELVLTGHDHNYERFAPQDAEGNLDEINGMRQFVVGSGGRSHYPFKNIQPNSEVRNEDTYGVLKLTLHSDGYTWEFLPEVGQTFTDQGSALCK